MGDMAHLRMLCLEQVVHGRTSRYDSERKILHPETLQRSYLKMAQKQITREIGGEDPVVESGTEVSLPETGEKILAFTTLHNNLSRCETLQELADVLVRPLGNVELTGGNVQKRQSALLVHQMNAAEEIVLPRLQNLVVIGDARCDQFRHATLHQRLGKFRILQLVAYGHLQPRTHQFWQIGVHGMIRETGHLHTDSTAIGTVRQHYVQYF